MKVAVRIICLAAMLTFGPAAPAADSPAAASLQAYDADLQAYRAELDACRQAHGGARDLPAVPFFLFGMGARTKLLYRDGILSHVNQAAVHLGAHPGMTLKAFIDILTAAAKRG